MKPKPLTPEELTCLCTDSAIVRNQTVEQTPKLPGQTRGMEALQFGLSVKERRFNITVVGAPGSGKTTTVQRVIEEKAAQEPPGKDICLHQNFTNPRKPKILYLQPGGGHKLNRMIEELLSLLDKQIPKLLEQPLIKARMQDMRSQYEEEERSHSVQVEEYASGLDLVMQTSQQGVNLIPLVEGRPMKEEEYLSLPVEQRREIEERRKELLNRMSEVQPKILALEKRKREDLESYVEGLVRDLVTDYMTEMRKLIDETPEVADFLDVMRDEIIAKRFLFLSGDTNVTPFGSAQVQVMRQQFVKSCKLNVLVDRSGQSSAPAVSELNPTYTNLIGGVDFVEEQGVLKSDFSQIRAGSLLQASGGYLLLQVSDLIQQPVAYAALKRALRSGKVQLQDPMAEMGWRSVSHMEPDPVEFQTRVILVGDEGLIHTIRTVDDEFSRLFKVTADFSGTLVRTPELMDQYVEYIEQQAAQNGLLPMTQGAIARLIEESSRLVSHQNRLTAQMTELLDILTEANHLATSQGHAELTREIVHEALSHKMFRHSKIEELVKREITEGTILLDFEGKKTGQVNGLAVYQTGRVMFGVPTRITAQAYAGRRGLINVEREADLSGRIHTKGVLILNGYLGKLFARKEPLALSVSITFEQNYGGIDGDSATAAEFFVTVSAISGVPIKQSIAVTGSMNQHGEVQPIGGVNEKIIGFYQFVREHGFPEGCGVIIPAKNQVNLMLPDEVIQAVSDGRFNIYPIDRVEDGLELMTDKTAGEILEDGTYPGGTLFDLTMAKLKEFSKNGKDDDAEDKPDERAAASAP
ncbi:MAG: AAA family ATPase [SAR324 cluster bacterium]|nr:AAA family ATPase [SAR324 cluster bacterium]